MKPRTSLDFNPKVYCGADLSDATACSRGVPQGSVLGPMLFVLYTRDICRILPTTVCHQEFADDIVIDISDENPTTVCNALTAAVTSLANWLHEIGLLLNSQKNAATVYETAYITGF